MVERVGELVKGAAGWFHPGAHRFAQRCTPFHHRLFTSICGKPILVNFFCLIKPWVVSCQIDVRAHTLATPVFTHSARTPNAQRVHIERTSICGAFPHHADHKRDHFKARSLTDGSFSIAANTSKNLKQFRGFRPMGTLQ
jgi:hypothetical protein